MASGFYLASSVAKPINTLHTGEVLFSPNGSEQVFSGTVVNSPNVVIDGVTIHYTLGAVAKSVTSNSSGIFANADLDSGSITKAGLVDLDFNADIDAVDITIDYISKGLIQVILDEITGGVTAGKKWTVELDQNAKDDGKISPTDAFSGTLAKEVVLSGLGYSGTETFYFGLHDFMRLSTNEYGMNLNLYRDGFPVNSVWNYNDGSPNGHGLNNYDSVSSRYEQLPAIVYNNDIIYFSLYSTDSTIILTTNSGGRYGSMAAGIGQRLVPAGNYIKPYFVFGCVGEDHQVNDSVSEFTSIARPYTGSSDSNNVTHLAINIAGDYVYPDTGLRMTPQSDGGGSNITNFLDTEDGKILFTPCVVRDNTSTMFQVELLYSMASGTPSTGNTVTDGSSNVHDVFPRAFRTTQLDHYLVRRPA